MSTCTRLDINILEWLGHKGGLWCNSERTFLLIQATKALCTAADPNIRILQSLKNSRFGNAALCPGFAKVF
jgi:hypothetical protein